MSEWGNGRKVNMKFRKTQNRLSDGASALDSRLRGIRYCLVQVLVRQKQKTFRVGCECIPFSLSFSLSFSFSSNFLSFSKQKSEKKVKAGPP